jgi:hypothetical protein
MSKTPARYFSIEIPTKPYLKQYLESLYGDPITFSTDNYFGISLLGFLEKKFYRKQTEAITHRQVDRFTSPLKVLLPKWWLTKSDFGTEIPEKNIILLNKLFEERFEEDLCKHCLLFAAVGVEIKIVIEEFCRIHNIEIETHITAEALKKKEYRYRISKQKEFYAHLSRQISVPLDQIIVSQVL